MPKKRSSNSSKTECRRKTFCHVFTMTENRLTISDPRPEVTVKSYEAVFKHVLMDAV